MALIKLCTFFGDFGSRFCGYFAWLFHLVHIRNVSCGHQFLVDLCLRHNCKLFLVVFSRYSISLIAETCLAQLPKFEVGLELSFCFSHFFCCWRRRLRFRCCLLGIINPGRFLSILTRTLATVISVLFYTFLLLLLYPYLLSLPLPEY